jgi:HEAT repeat protein
MFSSKPFSVVACLFLLAQTALAEKPNDNRSNSDSRLNESRQSEPSERGGKTLDQWLKELKNPDPYHRSRAVMYLIQFKDVGQHVPELIKLLRDGDASPRMKTILALQMIYIPQVHRQLVIKELGRCVASSSSQSIHKYEALKSLMRFGYLSGSERDVIMDIALNLNNPSTYELRSMAIDALLTAGVDEKKGPEPRVTDLLIPRATPSLEVAEEVRYKAVMALGAMGRPQDPKKLNQVTTVLRAPGNAGSRNKIIRMWSRVGLMALDKVDEKELGNIAENLKDPDSGIRAQAALALGALREKSHAYVGNICDMGKRETDQFVKTATAQALGRMGNKGKRVIDTLLSMIEDATSDNMSSVLAACSALKELGVNDAEVIQSLEKLSKQPSLRQGEKELIRSIIEALKNPAKPVAKDAAKDPGKGVAGPGR